MKDVFLATDELSKLKIQTIVPTAEHRVSRSLHSQPKKLRAAQILLGWRPPQPKRVRGGGGGAGGGRPTSRTRSPATCAARHGTGLVSPSLAAVVESSLSPGKLSPPLCGSSLELRLWRLAGAEATSYELQSFFLFHTNRAAAGNFIYSSL